MDANEAVLGGFYIWGSGVKNVPFDYGAMIVIPRSTTALSKPSVTQIASQESSGFTPQASIAVRKSTDNGDGAWGEWEWVNPPMQLGVEYRTTERYRGKPVYCKLVDFGALPNNTTKNVSLNIDNPEYLVGIWGNSNKNISIPSNNFGGSMVDGSNIVAIWTNLLGVYISTNEDRSDHSAIVLVKYTKTTD